MHILVCGGAGYIGSHMVKMLDNKGYNVTTFDNLSTGHQEAVKWGAFVKGDLLNQNDLKNLFESRKIDAVMHFSERSLVGESVSDPALYYRNNVVGTFNLLEEMRRSGVDRFVFSSSAATYGNPVTPLIDENHPVSPINPYGRTKLMVEQMLSDYFPAFSISSVCLRYFNAAGADPDGEIGESHTPESHLIPNVLKAVPGTGNKLRVFGSDYNTADGTCVRDYIHINDLCLAHLNALDFMAHNTGANVFNLGNGKGFSILEIIKAAEAVTNIEIPFDYADRREGDPPTLVADSRLAQKKLGWTAQFTDVEEIIRTAWKWHRNQQY